MLLKRASCLAILAIAASCAPIAVQSPAGPRTLLFDRTGPLPPISISSVPAFSAADAPAADVRAKIIVGNGFRAQATYGLTGGRQACGALRDCTLRSATISGKIATYVRFSEPQTVDGTAFSHKIMGYLPVMQVRPDEPGSGLLWNGWCVETQGCNDLEALFLSLRVEA